MRSSRLHGHRTTRRPVGSEREVALARGQPGPGADVHGGKPKHAGEEVDGTLPDPTDRARCRLTRPVVRGIFGCDERARAGGPVAVSGDPVPAAEWGVPCASASAAYRCPHPHHVSTGGQAADADRTGTGRGTLGFARSPRRYSHTAACCFAPSPCAREMPATDRRAKRVLAAWPARRPLGPGIAVVVGMGPGARD